MFYLMTLILVAVVWYGLNTPAVKDMTDEELEEYFRKSIMGMK